MENQKLGRQTHQPGQPPVIIGHGCAGGRNEQEGPLGRHLDHSSKLGKSFQLPPDPVRTGERA